MRPRGLADIYRPIDGLILLTEPASVIALWWLPKMVALLR
jgi:hypothetical protein